MNKRTATGDTNALKLVQNGKNAPATPMGGTNKGNISKFNPMKPASGYIDQAPVTSGDTSFGKKFTNKR